jgi:predicted DNA-binding protein (MmcQ/YjbR family)
VSPILSDSFVYPLTERLSSKDSQVMIKVEPTKMGLQLKPMRMILPSFHPVKKEWNSLKNAKCSNWKRFSIRLSSIRRIYW